ncbi:hypothetical protein Fmac_023176 [Flemingia macrophylla]|uniref:non-specific serine/threonine protein kinase n=1 Tax=Flemingia macrophylla TaxID=520843 RepID=A0ABD1LKR7_9FABA
MAPVDLFCFFMFSYISLVLSAGAGYGNGHQDCPHSFVCGHLGTFHYPFTKAEQPHCGLIPIHNCDNPFEKTIQLEQNGTHVELHGVVTQQNAIIIFDEDFHRRLQENICGSLKNSYSLPSPSPLYSIYIKYNVTLFQCNRSLHINSGQRYFKQPCPHYDYDIYYDSLPSLDNEEEAHSHFSTCSVLHLPSKDKPDTSDILSFVSAEMFLQVVLSNDCDECYNHRGGQCRLHNNQMFFCDNYSLPSPSPLYRHDRESSHLKAKLIASILAVAGIVMMMVLAYCLMTTKSPASLLFWRESPTHRIIEEFLKEHGPLPTVRYNYSEVKKMTNSFQNKLGQGGFGNVYKGKLHDRRVVAVKILSKSDDSGEDFINEVASISRTSHVNIVRLLGFCLDRSKRALIYEFMSNGSLDKFIYEGKSPLQVSHRLDCEKLYDIAIGIARGLEYLHRGCNTRILHFDIKPHNILLDENFNPKISDFGLAKICPRKESMISIFGARGTAGYIAPEVFSRNFGAVSHKSDVYSYGMMVLEMVGRRKNITVEVDRSSKIYFPHWIYNRLESNQELGLENVKGESDEKMMRKMTIVGLWCIQTHPSTRPAISKVLEMLEGNVETLQVPPKPFLSSPSTSPVQLSCETL